MINWPIVATMMGINIDNMAINMVINEEIIILNKLSYLSYPLW